MWALHQRTTHILVIIPCHSVPIRDAAAAERLGGRETAADEAKCLEPPWIFAPLRIKRFHVNDLAIGRPRVNKAPEIMLDRSLTAAPTGRRMSMEDRRVLLYGICAVLDLAAVTLGFLSVELIRDMRWLSPGGIPLLYVAGPLFVLCAVIREAYSLESLENTTESVRRAIGALFISALTILLVTFYSQESDDVSRLGFTYGIFVSAILLIGVRLILAAIVRWGFSGLTYKQLLILDGLEAPAQPDTDVLVAEDHMLRPVLDDPVMLARITDAVSAYDRVILGCSEARWRNWIVILKATGVSFDLIVPAAKTYGAVGIGQYGDSDTLVLSRSPLSLTSRMKKRAFDLVLGTMILILIAPLMLVVAIWIRLDSRGPVVFTQSRIGQGNRPFRIYKFRSMRLEASDRLGARSTGRDDERITRVGRFIRRTSIDELPQLFNVLKGEMSLVGPRPHALGSLAGSDLFWNVSDRYWMRHALKPGITGLAQIRGCRGATEKREDLEARLRHDLEYLQGWSLMLDFMIIVATLRVLRHENAY